MRFPSYVSPIESMADYVRKLLQAAAEGADPQVVAASKRIKIKAN